MDDLISRQEAIEALQEHRNLFCDNTPETFSKLSYAEKSRVDELDMAIATLINLPSAQPETHEERTKTHTCDYINRKDAIEAHYEYCNKHPDASFPVWSLKILEDLPPAQPETHEERTETHSCDCISRQSAIDFIDAGHLVNPNEPRWSDNEVVNFLKSRPSAQPEIIRCKDCKHSRFFDPCFYCYEFGKEIIVPENGFCFMAERRTVGN